ncbi:MULTISPECIES: AEC family transporter [Variovorax]|uniref:AEC family transporter n=1 Tax=Variovorax TaxID=34072 RepID=UPI00086E9825|nr:MULTISPECIES: AEC family transporter [Variovorax]ODU15694.1 MAG: transporter [Variovorax sp. SCN 67-85]ODV27632.1 MAG: transporter [Variovorax sp. SCN 67-20]OJZ11517.1 MAG: transporter [Variovorax sp. 67-131]UKI05834.1 AEC family transporter [Variovorax paradoxus]
MNYAQLLFPDFSLIAIGWLLCRYTALDRRVWDQVESLVYYFLFPVLLFHSIVRSPLDFGATSNLLIAGLCIGAVGIALAYALPFVPGIGSHIDRRDHAASAQVAFRFNSFICLALAERLAGSEGLLLIAVLIGVCVPIFNIAAVWPMTRHAQTGFVQQLVRNPLIVATVAGLLANVLGLTVPNWATPTLTRIGAASLALGLLAAGAGMKFSTLGTGKMLAVSILAIRHLILPLVAWGLALALRLDAMQASVLMAFSAVPTASSAYVLAARMGYNGPYVAGLVTLSTLLGVLSLPFALALPR